MTVACEQNNEPNCQRARKEHGRLDTHRANDGCRDVHHDVKKVEGDALVAKLFDGAALLVRAHGLTEVLKGVALHRNLHQDEHGCA